MDGVTLRLAHPEDGEAINDIYTPYVLSSAATTETVEPGPAEMGARILRTLQRYPWIVAEYRGEVIGYSYAGPFKPRPGYDWAVETSIYVKQGLRRKGTGSMMYQALHRILSAQGIHNANACITFSPRLTDPYITDASRLFHANMGYSSVAHFHRCVNKFGLWYDTQWLEKMLAYHREQPPSVIALPDLDPELVSQILLDEQTPNMRY